MASSDRKPYLTATSLTQGFLNECHDNLVNDLRLAVDVETPVGTLHLSDRNMYVGSVFYEARLNFPVIQRTIGEFLGPSLEFSSLKVEINNADGKYNNILPAGEDYDGWIGRRITVRLGLRDVDSTYSQIFSGQVTEEGGFQRTTKSFILTARNDFDRMNVEFPTAVFSSSVYPFIEAENDNAPVPIIYGDWTVNIQPGAASVPAIVTNGANPDVDGSTSHSELIDCVISLHDNSFLNSSFVLLRRGDLFYLIDPSDIVNVVGNRTFSIRQEATTPPGVTFVEGEPYRFQSGDKFFVRMKGKDLGAYSDNIVWQARDILITHGNVSSSEFDASWQYFRDKATPAASAISTFKSRVWIQQRQPALAYALSMLEQVRIEGYINRNLKLALSSYHLDEFVANPSFTVRNWDVERETFSPRLDDRNNFNRVRASYNFFPNINENFQESPIFKNPSAIAQAGKAISKRIVFPNLYDEATVNLQLIEILKIAGGYIETIEANLTWRSLLLDIGNFVKLSIDINGTKFDNIPGMVREVGYDPDGIKIPVKIWSFQMLPFPGYSPAFSGITGGSTATIIKED